MEDRGEIRSIFDNQIVNNDEVVATLRRPRRRRAILFNDGRRFLRKVQILDHTFNRAEGRA